MLFVEHVKDISGFCRHERDVSYTLSSVSAYFTHIFSNMCQNNVESQCKNNNTRQFSLVIWYINLLTSPLREIRIKIIAAAFSLGPQHYDDINRDLSG